MRDLLDGCEAKVARARETLVSLEAEIKNYLSGHESACAIDRKFLADGLSYAFIVKGSATAPVRFSVLAGEIVHQLRSSLDHLVTALVIRNGKTPIESNGFPICATLAAFDRTCRSGALKGVSATAREIITSAQPYKTKDINNSVLYLVNRLNNIDKHKLPLIVCAVGQLGSQVKFVKSSKQTSVTGFGDPRRHRITEEGVVVFTIQLMEPDSEFEAEIDYSWELVFERCGNIELAPVAPMLTALLHGTEGTIQSLRNEFAEVTN